MPTGPARSAWCWKNPRSKPGISRPRSLSLWTWCCAPCWLPRQQLPRPKDVVHPSNSAASRRVPAGRLRAPRARPELPMRWKTVRGAFTHTGRGPALGDGFPLGIEAHRVRTVGAEVAKQRAFPAAERVVGHRHRQRHVDADHADLDVVAEAARRLAVAREDAGAVAILVRIDQIHGLLQRFHAHHAEHRAKNFFLVNAHA